MVRERMTQFVIQESLSFNHFDNPRLTKMIQDTLQSFYTHVSRTTLGRHCLNMWKDDKQQLITGFQNLNTSVNLTSDVFWLLTAYQNRTFALPRIGLIPIRGK